MILKQHKELWEQIFKIPGFIASPFFMFGFQEMDFRGHKSFKAFLKELGIDVTVLDYDDLRADIHLDMNYPIRLKEPKFKVVTDIGCLEHVLNTKQCLQNEFDLVEYGGLYLLHTPVNGYLNHGIHTFSPKYLRAILEANGFKILLDVYTTKEGKVLLAPTGDTLIWLVAKKVKQHREFITPIDNHGKFEIKTEAA